MKVVMPMAHYLALLDIINASGYEPKRHKWIEWIGYAIHHDGLDPQDLNWTFGATTVGFVTSEEAAAFHECLQSASNKMQDQDAVSSLDGLSQPTLELLGPSGFLGSIDRSAFQDSLTNMLLLTQEGSYAVNRSQLGLGLIVLESQSNHDAD